MNPSDDIAYIIDLARSHAATGKTPKYLPALDLCYARTIVYLIENYQPKSKTIKLTPSDAETRPR